MENLLEVRGLETVFDTWSGMVRAVRGVDLAVRPGESIGIVGEFGCGKSVTMLSILGLLDDIGKVVKGEVIFDGKPIHTASEKELQGIRGRHIGMIFQDPMTSLNPVYTVGDQLTEHLYVHRKIGRKDAWAKAREALGEVGIPEPEARLKQYPHEFSGGMRQRVMIAMALITGPKLLIADEPTTALDVTIQAQIMELLQRLRKNHGTAVILITHDLGVVADFCERVYVMYGGKIIEHAPVRDLYYRTSHPYTQGLLGSVPNPETLADHELTPIPGQPPDLLHPPAGCPFVDRCPQAMKLCAGTMPPAFTVDQGHDVACWLHHPQIAREAVR